MHCGPQSSPMRSCIDLGNAALLKTVPVVQGILGSACYLFQCWFVCITLLTDISALAI